MCDKIEVLELEWFREEIKESIKKCIDFIEIVSMRSKQLRLK